MRFDKLLTGISLLIAIGLSCCSDDDTPDYPDLTSFLRRFEDEASNLGFAFDLSKVQAAYVDQISVAGKTYCGYVGGNTRRSEV
jgi:hypothetical protein